MKLGFISRLQFKRGLNWQQRSRHVFFAISFFAPLMMFVPNIAQATSIIVEAENFSTMSGVIKETTTDIGGGKNLRSISTGDWMAYNVDVPVTGSYKIIYRVASPETAGKLIVKSSASADHTSVVNIGTTGGWQTWKNVAQKVSLQKGKQTLKIYAKVGGFNLNRFRIEKAADAVISSSAPAVSSSSSSKSSIGAKSSAKSSIVAKSSSSSSSGSSLSAVTRVAGPVEISWTAPKKRENGAALYIDELGGYKIRYKKSTATQYTYVLINDPWAQAYKFDWLEGDYIFQIAAFDKNGIYSLYETIRRD